MAKNGITPKGRLEHVRVIEEEPDKVAYIAEWSSGYFTYTYTDLRPFIGSRLYVDEWGRWFQQVS